MNKKISANDIPLYLLFFYFGLYLIVGLTLLIVQPFGSPPDEYNRYLIPEYIARNGTLPNGYEESIRIGGYGFSYGFQPILPYMLQGYAMRLVGCFTNSEPAFVFTGRLVNLLLGLLMAWIVLLLAQEWFANRRFAWLFAFLVTFLPQSLFLHTYINTDSCCMLSVAIMLYGLTRGLKDSFSPGACTVLALGIILCALSYYNAYGYILSFILLFTASFLRFKDKKLHFELSAFLRKGAFLSAIVLPGIGWWFIRSALLYNGDFLGMKAREHCASLFALPFYHPNARLTWQNQGYSVWDMLSQSGFVTSSTMSFIAVFGPMAITTSIWIYRFFKALFLLGSSLSICFSFRAVLSASIPVFQKFYHANMIFCILMPLFLSIYYSYTTDFQPQGRYLLPSLIPLCFYTVRGFETFFQKKYAVRLNHEFMIKGTTFVLCATIVISLFVTVYGYVLPYYASNPVAK